MALSSCVYAFRRLTRPGMSEEIRLFFIRKHISYVAAFIIIWTFYLASSYFEIYTSTIVVTDEPQEDVKKNKNIQGNTISFTD
jgi:hypothetical protein